MNLEQPIILKIEKIVDEARDTKTLVFNHALDTKPGQFVNVWIPRVNEKPFSVSYQDNGRFAITCFEVGPFSKQLNSLKVGDKIGIRGPYGNGFTLKKGHVAIVGGGCGTAPVAFLANELKKAGTKVEFIVGARTAEHVLYKERMEKSGVNIHIATDDGSVGHKGFSTELLEKVLSENKNIEMVYTCGPEAMMKKVIDICDKHDIDCEASLERYMKCGFGICGQCCVDGTGARVCKEGPVFNKEKIKKISEFNKYKRDATGKKVAFG